MPLGHQDLAAHEVDAGHDFGDGVFDLDARVHFDEEVLVAIDIEQELDRAGAAVVDGTAERGGRFADLAAERFGEVDARRDFDDLLVAALHRTVAFPQVDEVAVRVAEDLHLDVLGAGDVALEEHLGAAERGASLALRLGQLALEFVGVVHDAHTASTAAETRLDHQREADALRFALDLDRVGNRVLGAGDGGHAGRHREFLRGGLVAERFEVIGCRPDELDAGLGARPCERGVLGQEAVARVDAVDTLLLRQCDNRLDVQIGPHRFAARGRTDEEGLVSLEAMQREAVLLAVDRDRAHAEFRGGTEAADGNLRAVGDEQFPHICNSEPWSLFRLRSASTRREKTTVCARRPRTGRRGRLGLILT